MSKVLADTLQGRAAGNEAPNFPKGLTSAGIGTFSDTTSGVSTTTGALVLGGGIGVGGSIHLNDSKGIILGSGGDLQLVHDHVAGDSYITDAGTGALKLDASEIVLQHAQTAKITTTPTGIVVNGICTATTFEGDGAALTGLPAGFSWIEGNLF